jgi:hypothetical protein
MRIIIVFANPPDLVLLVIVSEITRAVKKEYVDRACPSDQDTYYRSNDSRTDATLLQQEKVYD